VLLSRASRVIQISQIAIACSALSAEPAPKCPTHVKWPRRTMAWRRSRPTTVGYGCGCRASQCLHYEAKRRSRSWLGARQKLASAIYASSREFLDSLICHPCKTVITAGFHRAANLLRDDRLGSGTWVTLIRKQKENSRLAIAISGQAPIQLLLAGWAVYADHSINLTVADFVLHCLYYCGNLPFLLGPARYLSIAPRGALK
jgi:hypothetical protein